MRVFLFVVRLSLILFVAPAALGAIQIKGVSYTPWSADALFSTESDESLVAARAIGCNWIALCVWWFQDDPEATVIEPDYERYSVDPNSVAYAIQRCHQLGMKVMLKPMVDCRDGSWRGEIQPCSQWFASYREFITFWADLAAAQRVEMLCVGCELKQTVGWSAAWRQVVEAVRQRYSGPLTYAANHGTEQTIDWWDAVDYIGIDAYYPLTDQSDPSLEQLKAAWQNRCQSIGWWITNRWPTKKVIFTEVGYQSVDGTNRTPWWTDPSRPIDLQEQADCYEALLSQCKDQPWWLGAFWWNWEADPHAGGVADPYHPMQNKPAEQVLRRYYTIFVDANSPADPGEGTFEQPFRRIQDALDAAAEGDVIEIRPGHYTSQGNYDLNPNGKNLMIRSVDPEDPEIVAQTVIDAGGAGRGFCFNSGEDPNCVLAGVTICGGDIGFAGGILCQDSSPTIVGCVIRDNSSLVYGGGVFCWGSNSRFVRCIIQDNTSAAGGGVECWSGQPVFENCIIAANTATDSDTGGGGVDCFDGGNVALVNCTVVRNAAPAGSGGGLLVAGSEVRIENSIFWANTAKYGPQIAVPSWFGIPGTLTVQYSDIQGGQDAVDCGSASTVFWGSGNMDAEPLFADLALDSGPESWDLHLQSAYGRWDPTTGSWLTDTQTSPCIDAGDPNAPYWLEPWPNGRRVNIGAYGGTPEASMGGNPADLDLDGLVDFNDFNRLASKWGQQGCMPEDLNGDNKIDFLDVSRFAENWLWRRP